MIYSQFIMVTFKPYLPECINGFKTGLLGMSGHILGVNNVLSNTMAVRGWWIYVAIQFVYIHKLVTQSRTEFELGDASSA